MAFTQVTITQDFTSADGSEPSGTITFTPNVPMLNGSVVVPAVPVPAQLDGTGTISIPLVANTDPDTVPRRTAYNVAEVIGGARRNYVIQVPHDQGATVTLYSLAQLAAPPSVSFPGSGSGGGGGPNSLSRVVQSGATYPTRPTIGYVDWFGVSDPGAAMQAGDTWTDLPPTAPDAPAIVSATGGSASASITFTAPAWNGGSTVTGYTATSSPSGITGTGSSSPVTVSGLSNGTAYTFKVHATNAAGNSSESASSNSVTPSGGATAPGAPTIGAATAGDASASVSFTAPGSNGGSAITGYTATSSPGGFTGTGGSSPITVSGLTNSTAYTFTVHATNAIGDSAESSSSNSVSPAASGTAQTDNFTGSDGSSWNAALWNAAAGTSTTLDIQSNQGHCNFTSAGAFEEVGRSFNVSDSANWRIQFNLVQVPSTSEWFMKVPFQATAWDPSLASNTAGYYLLLQAGGTSISKRDDFSTLVNFTGPTGARWVDVKVIAGTIYYRFWTGLVTDAPAYSVATNPSPVAGTGKAGICFGGGSVAGAMDFLIDDVLFDTNPS